MNAPRTSVIISTYNQPMWLEKVLWGYEMQTETDFEIVIADDGSTQETRNLINKFKGHSHLTMTHLWQPDEGFQKTKILNKAIMAANADYLIFTDGDCIPRCDFVATHLKLRKVNCALSGGYLKLSESISRLVTEEDIKLQRCFDVPWLLAHGLDKSFKLNKLSATGFRAWLLNTFTPTKATFDGMNVSGWKKDIMAVNGFDERMEYGGEDREIGERMKHLGVRFLQTRYSTICVHLHHERPYKNDTALAANKAIRKDTKKNKTIRTLHGIKKE